MSKYKSREAPIPGSSVSETHPVHWSYYVRSVEKLTAKWHKDYGHKYDKKNEPVLSSLRKPDPCQIHMHGHPPDSQVPFSKPKSCLKPCIQNVDHPDLTGHGSIEKRLDTSRSDVHRSANDKPADLCTLGSSSSYVMPKMALVYLTPGNVQQHNPVKYTGTLYSSPFGHYSYQASLQNASNPASVSYMQNRKCPYAYDIQKFQSDWDDPEKVVDIPKIYNVSMLAGKNDICSFGQFRRGKSSFPDLAPKATPCHMCHQILCNCMPWRHQKVPEENGPETKLPSQIWCGPTYSGNRRNTETDTVRHKLNRGPDLKTSMNHTIDEMQQGSSYDGKCAHSGSNSHSCATCRQECKAERASEEKEGNGFTTEDT